MYFKRISELRVDSGKTQKQVSESLKYSRQVYGRYERGDREIPVSLLIDLAGFYGVSTDYIVGLTENKS